MAASPTEDKEAILTAIRSAYSKLIGKEFTGVYENTANLYKSETPREIIRIEDEEMSQALTAILQMDNKNADGREVVWKAITRNWFDGVYGTRLWCESVEPEVRHGQQQYVIKEVESVKGDFDLGYKVITNVRVEIL